MREIRYPLSMSDDRSLPSDYDGDVFIWDIDKTYLSTHFSSMKGLARIPLEFAVDKRAIPGMPEVLRGLRRGPGPRFAAAPLYFVSSSPPQLKSVIQRKMLLDGVQPDGFTFKNWGKTLRQLRPDRLHDHLGYKLCALLLGRLRRPQCREFLFGDDAERDAEAYSLYAAILSGERTLRDVVRQLEASGVKSDDHGLILDLIEELPTAGGQVGRIFIHVTGKTSLEELMAHGPKVCPIRNAFQLALALFELGLVDDNAVVQARTSVRVANKLTPEEADQMLQDALARGLVTQESLTRIQL